MHKKIKMISFDVDGTMIDPEYNDLIWFKEIPELLAGKRLMSFEEARRITLKEYESLGSKNLKWYDINYWIDYFDLKKSYREILEKYETKIKIFPSVIPLLENLKKRYELIIITTMPREFLSPKIVKLEKYFKSTFSAVSDYRQLKNANLYRKISYDLKMNPFEIMHIGDSWSSDYLSAKKAGMNTVFLDQSKSKVGEDIIYDLEELNTVLQMYEK